MNNLIGLLLFFFGGFIGVATMCIVQVGAQSEKDYIMSKKANDISKNPSNETTDTV